MKGILKIYHPDETLKYDIKSSYCKAVYSNKQHFLEVEIITDDSLDHVDDDSLQYNFPQLSFNIYDFPINSGNIDGKTFNIEDSEDDSFTEVNLFDDEEAYLYDNELVFSKNEAGVLQVFWQGSIDDFYTGLQKPVPFKLKCHFKYEDLDFDDE